ncbi:MAG: NAD(P)H-quinone oxidoreductase subunit I, chloroplastic [Candidatus Omnitrophica bacterium]|nr:NAD(P)H-quinone oxidoreductase subunit I, chloroplastic [Candidatus Omnitrophota bacterium]
MTAVVRYFKEVFEGAASLVTGMMITLRYARRKPVTVLYPMERVPMKRFKGPISFVVDDKSKDHLCIACNACIKTCPSRCMSLKADKSAVDGKRVLTDFKVNYMLCSLCSLCIDVCPTDALRHDDPNYDMVSLTQKDLVMDLLDPFRQRKTPLTQIPVVGNAPAAAKPAAAPPATPPAAGAAS